MPNIVKPIEQLKLLQLPASQLLEKFGSGGHKPGSGSAAALMGIIACKLLRTVITLTKTRDTYKENFDQLNLVDRQLIDRLEPFLIESVQSDAIQFDRVIKARRERDATTDSKEKKRLGEKALRELEKATEIPLEIAKYCIDLAERGLAVFDLGFRAARGDSGVAISAAISAANGSLFIVYLNLTQFKGGQWSVQIRNDANSLFSRSQSLQQDLFRRVTRLQEEGLESPQLQMKL
jgi:formiminotetrahydrofolate cyclodeaminase